MLMDCPDNSTECLLRGILDATSGYNWDPVTFAFTAAFTILSFVVAIAALTQALFAAGPGRLKASERAIGPTQHRERAETQFSWQELRFRTIVKVPVLDIAKIREYRPTIIPISGHDNDLPPPVSAENLVVAGWSQLVNDLSLKHVDFRTMECLTDYLPGDIPAAPAWARLETLVLLCIMKGCTTITEEGGYLVADGPAAQLSWNLHPVLGPVGQYRTWNVQETAMHTIEEVQAMIPIFLGCLFLGENVLFKPLTKRRDQIQVIFDIMHLKSLTLRAWEICDHQHDHCLMRKYSLWTSYFTGTQWDESLDKRAFSFASAVFADRPAKAKAFPLRVLQWHSAIKTMYEGYFPWLILTDTIDTQTLTAICGADNYMFFDPAEVSYNQSSKDTVLLNSWLVGASQLVQSGSLDSSCRPRLMAASHPNNTEKFGRAHSLNVSRKSMASDQSLSSRIESGGLRICKAAISHLVNWLSDGTYFESASKHDRWVAQYWLNYQLAEIDWFLSHMGNDAICAASNMVVLGCKKFIKKVWTKVPRRFVLPETLDAFDVDWRTDANEKGVFLIRGYVDSDMIRRMFAHTKNYIERNRDQIHAVKCPVAEQGFYYETNNWRLQQKMSKQTTRQFQSPKKDTDSSEIYPPKSSDTVTREVSSDGSDRIKIEQISNVSGDDDNTVYVSNKPATSEDEARIRRMIDSEQDEAPVHIDRKIAALEAFAFLRAAVFAAFLATGTDTSLVLTSDKRWQLVQVQ